MVGTVHSTSNETDRHDPSFENQTQSNDEYESVTRSHGRTRPVSRRALLSAGGTAVLASFAGCVGGSDDTTESTGSELETPWTTEELADQVEDGTEVTFYMASGTQDSWHDLIDVVNDEYDTDLTASAFVSDGGEVSQRLIQEQQANNDQADLVTVATDIRDMVHDNGPEEAENWFELGIDENFWFSEELPSEYTEPWYVSTRNAGPTLGMGINPEIFESRGLDYPETYNDLFDEQYRDLETALPSYLVASQIGWVVGYHASQMDMSNQEWVESLSDHLDFSGFDSHTSGARAVGEGRVPLMFYNFPHTMHQFIPDLPIEAHFPEVVPRQMSASFTSINKGAPNPWAARFVLSAMMEESVQRRMIDEVTQVNPGRGDLDYSDHDLEPHIREYLETETKMITLWEEEEFVNIGREARNEWFDY